MRSASSQILKACSRRETARSRSSRSRCWWPSSSQAFARLHGWPTVSARLTASSATASVRRLLARGFRADFVGVAMECPAEPGYNRPDIYLIDDWR
jgi:hypothetical protein